MTLLARPATAWVALGGCLAATVVAGFLTWRQAEAREQMRFQNAVEVIRRAVMERMDSYAQVLKGAVGLFAASPAVEEQTWRAYFDSLDLSRRYQGLQALGYIERIPPPALREGKVIGREMAGPGAGRAGDTVSRYVVKHVEPLAPNREALGYDIGSEPRRRQAADEAAETGKPTLTRRITLVQAAGRPGLLLLMPIYARGANPSGMQERRACLEGWVYAAFVMEDLMASLLSLDREDVRLEIYDGMRIASESLLFSDDPTPESVRLARASRFETTAEVLVGQRSWTLRFRAGPAFGVASARPLPLLVSAAGLCISLLIFGLVRSLTSSQQRAVVLAGRMTERLRLQERALHSSNDGVFLLDAVGQGQPMIYANPAFERLTGYALEECNGKSTTLFAGGDANRPSLPRLRATLKAGGNKRAVLHELRKDGSRFWAEFRLSPVCDERGQLTHLLGIVQDITELKDAEARLSEVEKQYRELVDRLNVGVFRSTPGKEGQLLEANPALVRMFEADSKEQLLRHPVNDFYVDPARREDFSGRLMRHGFLKNEELELKTLKGGTFWAFVSAIRKEDDRGHVIFEGLIEDVSDRKRAEDLLERERLLLRTVLDNVPDAIYAKDTACRKTVSNQADVSLVGCTTEAEVLGKTDADFYSPEVAAAFSRDDQLVLQSGQAVLDREELFVDALGRARWLRTSKLPLRNRAGLVIGLLGIGHDITERKQAEQALRESEERFELAVEGANDGIWDWNVTTNEVYFSPRWKSMLGYQEHEIENNFAAWERLVHPEDHARALERIRSYFADRTPTYELEHRLRHKDGSYRWILARGVALRDAQGKPVRMAGSHVDLTERKQAEEHLRQANAELAESREALARTLESLKTSHQELKATQLELIQAAKLESVGTLAAGVAHEVKNPLQMILMGLAYVSANVPAQDENLARTLNDMRDAVKRADAIVRELLQFSAASEFTLKEEDLNALVDRSLWLVHNELEASRIRVVRDLGRGLPPGCFDRGRLEQVFINLFLNAVQAMAQGGTLQVRTRAGRAGTDLPVHESLTRRLRSGGFYLVAEVRDDGPGIPEKLLSRVFDPFFTTKPAGVGTGLGLSVVRRIVELHGGAIELRNASPGGGVLVTLVIRAWPDGSAGPGVEAPAVLPV